MHGFKTIFDNVKAEDFMTKKYKWIKENDTLTKALSLLDETTNLLTFH